jgi:hypothetical protein
MNLLPRFYYLTNKYEFNDLEIVKEKDNTGYVNVGSDNIRKLDVLKNKTSNGKFININDKLYFRPKEYTALHLLIKYICSKCDSPDNRLRVIFRTPTKDIDKLYNWHPDLYYIFYDFDSFEDWYYKNDIEILQLLSDTKIVNIDYCEKLVLSSIKDHFESTIGNIFLLKIKFDENDMSDFILKE